MFLCLYIYIYINPSYQLLFERNIKREEEGRSTTQGAFLFSWWRDVSSTELERRAQPRQADSKVAWASAKVTAASAAATLPSAMVVVSAEKVTGGLSVDGSEINSFHH